MNMLQISPYVSLYYQFTEKKMVNFSISFTFYMSPSYRFFQVFLLVSE